MTNPDRKVWDDVLTHLRTHHPTLFRKWFEDELEPLPLSGGTLPVRTRSSVHRVYLNQNCLDQFNDAIRSITGALLSVRFLEPGERVKPSARVVVDHGASQGSVACTETSLSVNPDYGFLSFVEGPTNRFARAAAQAVADAPGH